MPVASSLFVVGIMHSYRWTALGKDVTFTDEKELSLVFQKQERQKGAKFSYLQA